MSGTITSATALGGREAQEDRFAVAELGDDGVLLAVFDGHNGATAADVASGLVVEAFVRELGRYGDGKAAIEATIGVLRAETASLEEGSSVSLAYVDGDGAAVVVGVLGDSPVIVREARGECVLGPLHNTMTNPEDAALAVARGAALIGPYLCDPRTLEGVNLTRTIGDAALTFLGREPEVRTLQVGPSSFVVVGTDGLFSYEAPTPHALVDRVAVLVEGGADAGFLVTDALERGSEDNVTALLWRPAARDA